MRKIGHSRKIQLVDRVRKLYQQNKGLLFLKVVAQLNYYRIWKDQIQKVDFLFDYRGTIHFVSSGCM